MDTRQLPVVVSDQYHGDLKNVFHYGVDTFGFTAALLFNENIERIVNNLGLEYYMYPECRFIVTKTRMYRNIILESYLIIYRITNNRVEVLRIFHSSICTVSRIREIRKFKI